MAIFYDYETNTGKANMEKDESLLNFAIENNFKEPILRFYGWTPACVSLGRNQYDKTVNKDFCKQNKIDIVKRLTGGRALLHANELTYSFISPTNFLNSSDSVILSYKEISNALILGFKKLGIDLKFPENKKPNSKFEYCMSISTGADLSFEDKKLIGSAQFRKNNYLLQHGSILIDFDKEIIKNIFQEEVSKDSIITLNEINPDLDIKTLVNSLKQGFEKYFNLNF